MGTYWAPTSGNDMAYRRFARGLSIGTVELVALRTAVLEDVQHALVAHHLLVDQRAVDAVDLLGDARHFDQFMPGLIGSLGCVGSLQPGLHACFGCFAADGGEGGVALCSQFR